jgi:hypothetical protein
VSTVDGPLWAARRAIRDGGLCGPCLSVLPVTGAAVALVHGPMHTETVCATDRVAARIDELQFDLGEGPCWEAFAAGRPVLVPDLHHGPHPRWPVFAGSVRAVPAGALFAFPLRVGTTGFGTLDLYRSTPGPLDDAAVHDARVLADTVAGELVRRILAAPPPGDGPDPWLEDPADRRQVLQATGMVMAQLHLPAGAACARLRAHAFATDATLADTAAGVLNHRFRLADDTG